MSRRLVIGEGPLTVAEAEDFVFRRADWDGVTVDDGVLGRIGLSRGRLLETLEAGRPVYGVTTGFGESCHRRIPLEKSETLQRNLVQYLLCGTGADLPREASRATLLFRLRSLCLGYSAVTPELVLTLRDFLDRDWVPVVPREGSLGASGDLIPLAYLARAIQGEGPVDAPGGRVAVAELLAGDGLAPYRLKTKEGLALVNGTSAMAGLALVNLRAARFLADLAVVGSSWLCLAVEGQRDAFSALVNERAKTHAGQADVARRLRGLLDDEKYHPAPAWQGMIQDQYSLRCVPQVLGPVADTVALVARWLEVEINGASDNPLVSPEGELAMGGNFYGGYLGQGMDYLKIALGHVADLLDRQIALVIDEKSSRGLPPNLADWRGIPEDERHLHHGLKGLHQAASAVTAETLARTMPNGVFSRSTESHNQDKVSLGMSAAVSCGEVIDRVFTVASLQLSCLAQALDLRRRRLAGAVGQRIYGAVRECVPFAEKDRALDDGIRRLGARLRQMAHEQGGIFSHEEA